MKYKQKMVKDLTPGQIQTLLEVKAEYAKLLVKTGVVRGRVNAIDLALKKKEKPIKSRDFG